MKTFSTRLLDLLQRHEDEAANGTPPDPAILCAGDPDLLPAFVEALRLLAGFHERGSVPPTQVEPITGVEGTPLAPTPTVQIAGYSLGEELGRGGMGVVYKAEQTALRRLVAVKMILAAHLVGMQALERFQREAQAVARLRHPGIVQVFEVGTWTAVDGGRGPFMALEFLAGGTLAKKLGGQPLPASEAATLVRALAQAMQHAHEAGVVHRDLKPANVLLTADGVPKIADFGVARLLDAGDAGTHTGAIMGTPPYMAPEQAAGETSRVGPAADVYALGAILYECLTGRPPFRGTNSVETLRLVRETEPVPPRLLNPSVPRDLETICLRCLRKEPEKRYASAQDLADDLRRFLEGRPTLARPVGALERTGKWIRRNPVVTLLTLATVLTLLGGLTASLILYYQALGALKKEKETAGKLEQTVDELSGSVAQGWLGQLGQLAVLNLADPLQAPALPGGNAVRTLTPPEVSALWELASAKTPGLRMRFLAKAFESQTTTRQVTIRAAWVMHSVIGLDEDRRQQAARLIASRLEEVEAEEQRGDLALLLAGLDCATPHAAATAFGVLVDVAVRRRLNRVVTATAALRLARRMEKGEAIARLVETLEAMQGDGYSMRVLGDGIEPFLASLPREQAEPLHRRVIAALATAVETRVPTSPGIGAILVRHLGALPRAEAVAWLRAALPKVQDREAARTCIRALSRLADDLPAAEAVALRRDLLQQLTRLLPDDSPTGTLERNVAEWNSVAELLPPRLAADCVMQGFSSIQSRPDFLAECAFATAQRMSPSESAFFFHELVEQEVTGMQRPILHVSELTRRPVAALLARVPTAPAQAMAAPVAALLLRLQSTAPKFSDFVATTRALADLVEVLAPEDGLIVAKQGAVLFLQGQEERHIVANTTYPQELRQLERLTRALAPAEQATVLFRSLDLCQEPESLAFVTAALTRTLDRLPAREAADLVVQAMDWSVNPACWGKLAAALMTAVVRLPTLERERVVAPVVREYLSRAQRLPSPLLPAPRVLGPVGAGVVTLFPCLGSAEAAACRAALVPLLGDAIESASKRAGMQHPEIREFLALVEAFRSLLTSSRDEEREREAPRLARVVAALLVMKTEPWATGWVVGATAKLVPLLRPSDRVSLGHQLIDAFLAFFPEKGSFLQYMPDIRDSAALLQVADPAYLKQALARRLARQEDLAHPMMVELLGRFALTLPAAEGADLLLATLEKEGNDYNREALARRLSLVVEPLPLEDARNYCRQAATLLRRALRQARERDNLTQLAGGLSTLLPWLDREEASALLVEAVAYLPRHLHPDDPSFALLGPGGRPVYLELFQPVPASTAPRLAVTAFLAAGERDWTGLAPLMAAYQGSPCPLATAELVEILKQPLCVGPLRDLILRHLKQRYGQDFPDLWAFVAFARAKGLDLDFAAPPRPPGQ
jgi:hypothetical protein